MVQDDLLVKIYTDQINDILESSRYHLSDLKPSEWAELNRVMSTDETSNPGPFQYRYTPYLREVVDCLSPNHPARIVAVKKGAQIGFSTGVIESGIGWIIAQNPGNILFLSGHQELSEEAMNGKIEKMIESCGLKDFIKPNVLRKKNQRTGNTSKSKEFPGGSLVAGSASNHKLLRQRSVRYGFIDDFDAAKKASKEAGDTKTLIQQRFAAYYDKMKLFYISTPELEENSNIEPVFKLGDQRRWFIPCPCCGEYISLHWSVEIEGKEGEMGGITWQLDETGKLIPDSVGYICQKCGDKFDESNKADLNLKGEWRPTAEPSEEGYYSYHISCLYAPPGMFDWVYYVRMYLEANPPEKKRDERLHQAFVNLALGETYSQQGEAPEAKVLQHNIRPYEIGIVPERQAIDDGNGKIIVLTCACDLNGIEDDARLDYEIIGWSQSGSSYSIRHGSIGTFVPRESQMKNKEDRARWTYRVNTQNSVWPELEKILAQSYITDTDRKMMVVLTGIDTGHYTDHVYNFVDRTNFSVVGVRGDKESKLRKYDIDRPSFKPALERKSLFLVDVNYVKDRLAEAMKLKWRKSEGQQPPGFMNFPTPSQGLYLLNNYFQHFESEHRILQEKDDDKAFRWVKKSSNSQNHFWDVRVYNMALKDILVDMVAKELKMKKLTWEEFCNLYIKK
jgi:phage terminase large subunit GpA-like protein